MNPGDACYVRAMREFWIWLALSVPSAIIAYGVHELMELYLKEAFVVAIAAGPGVAYLLWVQIHSLRRRRAEGTAEFTAEQLYSIRQLEAKERAERRRGRAAFWDSDTGLAVVFASLLFAIGAGFLVLFLAKMYFENLT